MDLTKSAYAGFKLYEVVPCMTETGHIWASGVIYYSSTFWGRLSDEQKAVFQEASSEGAAYFNQLIVEDEAASVAVSVKNGGKLLKPEAFEEWQKGAQGVWDDFAPIVGGIKRIKSVQSA
jgi:TRAP-type C4-dicarboxylate transport system substrate-binding protein